MEKPRYQWVNNRRWDYLADKKYDIIDTKNGVIIGSYNREFEVREKLNELNNRILSQIKHAPDPYEIFKLRISNFSK